MTLQINQPEEKHHVDAWERLGWIWTLLFLLSVLVSLFFALRNDRMDPDSRRLSWLLCILLLIIHTGVVYFIRRRPDNFREYQLPLAVYVATLLAITIWLISLDDAFYFLLFTAYGQIFSLLHMRLAIPAMLILTTAVAVSQARAEGIALRWSSPFVIYYVAGSLGGIFMAFWIYAIIEQSAKRRELIKELEQTQSNLAAAERREGQLAERQRLAREIHDTLAQGFTSIVMHLEALEGALPETSEIAQRHLDMARQTARDNLMAARRVVADLRPELLEKEPLPQALERVVSSWSQETGIQARANFSGEALALHPQIEVTLLRATQEALSNIRKHAQADEVNVTVTYFGEQVMLDVQDNGIGLSRSRLNGAAGQASGASSGFGLQAMRERVAQLNGTLSIESSADEGTTLVVAIPV